MIIKEKEVKRMKILVSGGWGYGNLGDDALLVATIDLLKEKYPNSEIVIMSYDDIETQKLYELSDIKVIPSVHRIISKKMAFNKLGTWGKSFNYFRLPHLIQRIISRFRYPYLINKEKEIYKTREQLLLDIQNSNIFKQFETSDLFIMSGGGYFNSWLDSLSSRVIELKLANKAKLKSLVIGQSIGPFITEDLNNTAFSGLKLASLISIRDKESYKELTDMGLSCSISPDLALSNINFKPIKSKEISIVLGEFPKDKMSELANALILVSKTIECSFKLLLTRLYNADVVSVRNTHQILIRNGVKVNLIIPSSYEEVQKELAESKVVVSRNLHGLILGWRAGVPSVCLNHERKFVTFMEQSKQSERLIGLQEFSKEKLSEAILNAYKNEEDFSALKVEIAMSVKENFFNSIDSLIS